jgi:N utilization substance protein B
MNARRFDPRKRQRARRVLLQALYQWQMTGVDADKLVSEFLPGDEMRGADTAYFIECLRAIVGDVAALDRELALHLDRPLQQVDPVARAVLRIGTYELLRRADVPARVAIDEAVNLAHLFGAEPAHRYVNGVLDRLARRLRGDVAAPKAAPGTAPCDAVTTTET